MNSDSAIPDARPVLLCAELAADWKAQVEELLFFNPRQAALENEILATIRAFGVPRVAVKNARLSIEVDNRLALGTLFARVATEDGEELAGILLFLRKDAGLLCLHLSVAESYSLRGRHAGLCVAARLLDEVRKIGVRIAGVDHIEVYYKRAGWQKLPLTARLL